MNRVSAVPLAAFAVALIVGAGACGDDGPATDTTVTESTGVTETTAVTESTGPVSTDAETTVPRTEPTETGDTPESTSVTGSSEPTGTAAAGEEPTIESASELVVGLSEQDAEAALEEVGWQLRVTRRDGQDLPVTMDLRTNRVNVEVVDGEVTDVLDIG